MAKGRKPKPLALRLRDGERVPKKYRGAPNPPIVYPDCPFPLDGNAARAWDLLRKLLEPMGVVSECDGAGLFIIAQQWGLALDAREQVASLAIEGQRDGVVKHPLISVFTRAWNDVLKGLSDFGMTPAARQRVSVFGGAGREGDAVDDALRLRTEDEAEDEYSAMTARAARQ